MQANDEKISYLKFLGGCMSPRNITNKRGELVTVNCGKCIVCLSKKQLRYEKTCRDMCSQFQYVYFYTLTYDEPNVPRCLVRTKPNYVDNRIVSYDVHYIDKTIRKLKTTTHKSVNYGKVIYSFNVPAEEKSKFDTFQNQARPTKGISLYNNMVRVIDNTDLQKFIKRLRFQISQLYDEKICHYSVSEYGPTTFRPHFHGVLCFNSYKLARSIESLVCKCWKLGNTDISLSRSGATTANYISGYIYSLVSLPIYLQGDNIRPKTFHSVKTLIPLHREIRDYLYEESRWIFEKFPIIKPNGTTQYIPTRQTLDTLFPRCYNYARQTDEHARELYSIYSKLRQSTSYYKCSDLTRYCITHSTNGLVSKFLSLLEIYPYHHNSPTSLYLSSDIIHCENITDVDKLFAQLDKPTAINMDYYEKVYQRIYNALYLSRHFMTFCCEKLPFNHVYNLVHQFHNYVKPQNDLKIMYRNMQKYYEHTGSTHYDIFYLQKSSPYIKVDEETGELLQYTNYPEYQKANHYLNNYFKDFHQQMIKNIKHKELNEKNYLMFNT